MMHKHASSENEQIGFSNFKESFLRDCFEQEEIGSIDELFVRVDERVNTKMAHGMKKAIHLIVEKFERHVKDNIRLFVQQEVDLKLKQ